MNLKFDKRGDKSYMNSIIKWAGGKEKELPYILENLPNEIHRYIEPFVGRRICIFQYERKRLFYK